MQSRIIEQLGCIIARDPAKKIRDKAALRQIPIITLEQLEEIFEQGTRVIVASYPAWRL